MGNSSLSEIKIENLPQKQHIPLFTEENSPTKDKETIEKEKENLKIISKHNKENKDNDLIDKCFLDHFSFRVLEKQARNEIIKQVSLCYAKAGTILFQQDNPPGNFFIISNGVCNMLINNESIKLLKKGECFGEIDFMSGCNREYTIKCNSDCNLWLMDKKNFSQITKHILTKVFQDNIINTENVPLIKILDHDYRSKIISNCYRETRFPNNKIFIKNQNANFLYLIKDGEIYIKKNNEIISTLTTGDYFGELSIISQNNRLLDIIPKTKTHLYSISISAIKKILGENYPILLILGITKAAFIKTKYFTKVKFLDNVLHLFKLTFYDKETIIIKNGTKKCDNIIITISGKLINNNTNEIICEKGCLLYGDEIYNNDETIINTDIKCESYSLLLSVKTKNLLNFIGCSFKQLGKKASIIDQLKCVSLFKNCTEAKLNNLASKLKTKNFKEGEYIIKEGEEGSCFYIIKKGSVDIIVKNKYIRTINENEFFGERALFFKEKRSASAKSNKNCEIFYLEKNDFENVIEKNLKNYLLDRLYLQDNSVNLDDLIFCTNLGSGTYGNVSLVKNKKNNYLYAIKNISNKQIMYGQLYKNLELERSILLQIDHPFIVKLVKSLKDKKYIYFLMDYIKGKELFDIIREIGLLNKEQTQFYSGSMMLAVDYLHERKFIFRDIKPENIMVLYNGYIKLIDFGTAKIINKKTKSLIGTPHYMAPEVILGEGYSFQVDYWSIAVCMYEFFCGKLPFAEGIEDTMEIYGKIINEELKFPDFIKDRDFKHLMHLMLNKNKKERYCKFNQINSHIWFKDFNWEELLSLNMKPAYLPKNDDKIINYNEIPYIEYTKNLKDWEPTKEKYITEKDKIDFDEWLENF